MALEDSYVQVAADGSGKKVDNSVITREPPDPAWSSETGVTVYRQRVVVSSGDNSEETLSLRGEIGDRDIPVSSKTLEEIQGTLSEIRDMLRMLISL